MRPVIADLGCAEIRSVDLLNSVQRRLRQRAEFDGFQCLIPYTMMVGEFSYHGWPLKFWQVWDED